MRRSWLVAALGTVLVLVAAVAVWPSGRSEASPRSSPRVDPTAVAVGSAAPVPLPDVSDQSVTCPAATVTVSTAGELTDALAAAAPGAVILLRDGVYAGNFTASTVASAITPIFLCGSRNAVLDAGGPKEGYVLHLEGAQFWRFVGFTVRNGQKGVMGDGAVGSVIQDLHVSTTGDEAIHLRKFSTDNLVIGNDIDTTGLRRDKFGEGVYVGTATSNWCKITDCAPDRSDRNQVIGNRISRTGSESVDIKEGTTGGVVRGNSFDGAGMTGADSWVDVKGNDWVVSGNSGVNSPLDGFQTHNILDDWGSGNRFSGNTADVGGDGFGYAFRPALSNVLSCDNTVSAAASGLANVNCQPS